jgi:indolepyruvate ferredoxin oxidoreductase beta subunit
MKAIEQQSQRHVLFDMEEVARRTGAMINAVMLGAIAGSGHLPMPIEAFESAIRADGKAVEANLDGFRAGLNAAREASANRRDPGSRTRTVVASLADLEREIVSIMSGAARDVIQEGARRLVAYQDISYAQLYIDRLAPIRLADERTGAGGKILRETARHLAVRMSYEDVIRVAEAKIDPARFARIAGDLGAKPDEPLRITEFLKPGIDEFCSILPPKLGHRIVTLARRRGWQLNWSMEVNSASILGYLRFWALAKLKPRRPRTYRFQEEQRTIEAWLAVIVEAAKLSSELALEVAECARLIKGYGDTHKRGGGNYQTIEERVIRPALAGHIPFHRAVDAVASARTAALTDPDGESLATCLSEIESVSGRRLAAE